MKVKIGDECRKLTGGIGVDVVFDCAGTPAGLDAGMDALRTRGTYVNVAGWEKPVSRRSPVVLHHPDSLTDDHPTALRHDERADDQVLVRL